MVRIASLFTTVTTLALAATSAMATPVAQPNVLQERTVYSPEITYPTHKTKWEVGKKVHVSWNASGLPDEAKKAKSFIKLGHLDKNSAGEHLNQTLAKGFKLGDGNVKFTLPKDLEPRDDYIVVLFGDSGNASPKFTIHE